MQWVSLFDLLASSMTAPAARQTALRQEAAILDTLTVSSETAMRQIRWLDAVRASLGTARDYPPLSPSAVAAIQTGYQEPDCASPVRSRLLILLAADSGELALRTATDLLVTLPPSESRDVLLALAPLFQRPTYNPAWLYPRLFAGLAVPALAAGALDLANFLTARLRLSPHPAADRAPALAELLGAVVSRLQRVEERPQDYAASPRELTVLVGEAVGLVVSLCSTLALVGNPAVVGKLHQAAELAHRRVRVEAGAALARLGESRGVDLLLTLTAEPVVRSRALRYLEELGALERVPAADRSPVARAAGDLAAWLAEPTQFGVPASTIELIDERRQPWPGFDEPIDCYLFDVEFRHGEVSYSTIALVGPTIHTFAVDLEDLAPDDIYAVFAGWQAEHPEIAEVDAARLPAEKTAAWQQFSARLTSEGYVDVQLVLLGRFFDGWAWVANARRDAVAGVVVIDGQQTHWYPTISPGPRALTAVDWYNLHKGRLLLRSFKATTT